MPAVLDKGSEPGEKKFVLRCLAYRKTPNLWLAVCLDLNVVTEGTTLREVQVKTHDAVQAYLETVLERGWEKELLSRKAPPRYWLRWYLYKAQHHLRTFRDKALAFYLTGTANQLEIA